MGFTPRYTGDTRVIVCSFSTDSATYSVASVSASDISMNFVNEDSGTHSVGAGTWGSISGNTASYTPDSSDAIVTTAGVYRWYPVVAGVTFDPQTVAVVDPTQTSG